MKAALWRVCLPLLDRGCRCPRHHCLPKRRGALTGIAERDLPGPGMVPEDELRRAAAHSATAMSPHYEEFGHFADPLRKKAGHYEASQRAIVANEVSLTLAPVDKVMVEETVDERTVLGEFKPAFGGQVVAVQLQAGIILMLPTRASVVQL